jgi:hypothetical protein
VLQVQACTLETLIRVIDWQAEIIHVVQTCKRILLTSKRMVEYVPQSQQAL